MKSTHFEDLPCESEKGHFIRKILLQDVSKRVIPFTQKCTKRITSKDPFLKRLISTLFKMFCSCCFYEKCFKKLYRICNVQGFTYCGNFGNPRHLFCIMQKPSISIFKVPFPFFMVNYPTRV